MISIKKNSQKPPFNAEMVDQKGLLSFMWTQFFNVIASVLQYIGEEQSFPLVNNQASAAAITPLKFDSAFTSAAFIEYLIQRTTTSAHYVQAGILRVVYDPQDQTWDIANHGTAGPDSVGVTITIDSTGQCKYTTSNLAGTENISRIVFRVRPLIAKHSSYSKIG